MSSSSFGSFIFLKCKESSDFFFNFFFHGTVRYKDLLGDAYADLSSLLKSEGNVCAIVYCLERTTCDALSVHLSNSGISCAGKSLFFHSQSFLVVSLRMC